MAKAYIKGNCDGCGKRLTLANTRRQQRHTPRTVVAPPYCDACKEVHGVEVGQVICVMDWRYGRYNEWEVLAKPKYDQGSHSWRVDLGQTWDNRSAAPLRHWAHWTGQLWEEGYL